MDSTLRRDVGPERDRSTGHGLWLRWWGGVIGDFYCARLGELKASLTGERRKLEEVQDRAGLP